MTRWADIAHISRSTKLKGEIMTLKEWTKVSAIVLLFSVVFTWGVALLAENKNSGPLPAVLWIIASLSTSILVLVSD
jgi:hypothetical protein